MPRAGIDADAVVTTAARLADAEGLEAVTLARVASELGVRPPSLYAHVDGLGDLRRRLATRGAIELTARLQAAAAGRAHADALGAIAIAYRDYAHTHPGTYLATQRVPDLTNSHGREAAEALVEVVLAVLRGYGLEGDEQIHAARIVRAALHGFATLELGEGFGIPLSLEESYERLIAVLDSGLRAIAAH
jgi:AcrR family transcriptional regulator